MGPQKQDIARSLVNTFVVRCLEYCSLVRLVSLYALKRLQLSLGKAYYYINRRIIGKSMLSYIVQIVRTLRLTKLQIIREE